MKGRQLSPTEVREAHRVFGNELAYSRVRVVEGARWTDLLVWRPLATPPPSPRPHNAVTLGWRCCFPVRLRTTVADLAADDLRDMAWLVHELTHAWQYQRMGWSATWKAAAAILRQGEAAYHYGGREGLLASARGPARFNVEQQAEIARDCYLRLRHNTEADAWQAALKAFLAPTR